MVEIRLGERARLAPVASIGLAQRVVPAFHMARFPPAFVHAPVPPAGQHLAIGLTAVTKTSTAFIRRGNALPRNIRQVCSRRSPSAKATICRVHRHSPGIFFYRL